MVQRAGCAVKWEGLSDSRVAYGGGVTRIRAHEPAATPTVENHGAAVNIALSFIRTMTVDPGIAPDLLTPVPAKKPEPGARGLMQLPAITAGGEFHPALRTPSRRNGQDLCILNRGVMRALEAK